MPTDYSAGVADCRLMPLISDHPSFMPATPRQWIARRIVWKSTDLCFLLHKYLLGSYRVRVLVIGETTRQRMSEDSLCMDECCGLIDGEE